MSILINMEMPPNCGECPCYYDGYCHGLQYREEDEDYRAVSYKEYDKKRRDDCPLIEVPKHGRLIEDTVLDTMSMWNTDREYDRGWDSAVQAARNRIKSAPTIIEAGGSHKCYHADGDCIHDNCDTCPNLCEVNEDG